MNQNPEQSARDNIDKQLISSGWLIQDMKGISLQAGPGVAVREYPTADGPADYILFVDGKPVGVIEAKREDAGFKLTVVEEQSSKYATSKLKYLNNEPLPLVYESTGIITRFTDYRDPKPRSREIFTFHRPESIREWLKAGKSLRQRLQYLPQLDDKGFRDCQINAIANLDVSFQENRPRALVQMATGAGKTFTAITAIYRLLKHANAKRVLFIVDTRNLGEQAEQEFMAYLPNDDNRKFTELYNVQRLKSSYVATDSQACISTIQRLYSILKGEELDESAEENNPAEIRWDKREPLPVIYNSKLPIEFFDVIIIDECHRSIYNLWKQVLDYFDAFLVGLTATPDQRTFGFFNQNVVSEYTHEEAVADGVNVGYDVFLIETEISKKGAAIWQGEWVDKRERLSRKKRWEQLDEEIAYSSKNLDKDIVNPSQIRAIIRTFKERLPEIFPDRKEVPKTLIFAKDDSHADDIIQIVREEFGEGNQFCKKVTYKADEDPKSVLAQFRNDYYPRVAVTVDMIATGTDVRPLECLIFMRDVKSKNYFEQMKGRGTRTINLDDLRKVTPSATYTKDHFVIIDAVGVTHSTKTDSRPLERKPSVPLKDLLTAVAVGARDEDLFTTLAGRLARFEQNLTQQEKEQFIELAQGKTINQVVKDLLKAYDPDAIEAAALSNPELPPEQPLTDVHLTSAQEVLIKAAAAPFTGKLNEFIEKVRKIHEQIIDNINIDKLEFAGWDLEAKDKAAELVQDFKSYLESHRDEITALQIYYNQPYRRREITEKMIKELLQHLKADKPALAPMRVWKAYEQLDAVGSSSTKTELTALVALIRRVTGLDEALTPYDKIVDRNFQDWIFKKHAGAGAKFTEEQMTWLRMMKDHIAISFHLDKEDFDYAPFNAQGGLGKAWQLFGNKTDEIIEELNEVLVA
ncbi:MAG: type I restriction-modification enzyme R subunit C-terminal domain-containing protein [Syntrophomonas sp.]